MSVTTTAERTRVRIQRFGEQQPDALRLARYASLAVRVDAPLLRALRTTLLPGSDAGIEADLWFSTLTESVSSQGFVLDGDVVAQLREELAAERVNDEQRALAEATRITIQAHRHWPESLRLEERATALALRTPPPAGAPIAPEDDLESLLRGLVKAMAESPSRGMEVARWAQRALVRLPKAARETEAALLLALGAAERLGTTIRFAGDDRPGRLPDSAAWMLPAGSFSRWTSLGIRRFDNGLEFGEPVEGLPPLRLPQTTPLFVEISWSLGRRRQVQTVSLSPGRTVEVPREARDIRFRSLAGEEFALESVEGGGEDVPSVEGSESGELARAIVTVEVKAPGTHYAYATGFFVAPDVVITSWEGLPPDLGSTLEIRRGDDTFTGHVIAEAHGTVLLRLDDAVPGVVVLPRRIDSATTLTEKEWRTADHNHPEIAGTIVRSDAEWHRPDGAAEGALLLRTEMGPQALWCGAPVVVDRGAVAQIVSVQGERIFARPMSALEPFILQSLRPAEPDPRVFVSYAPEDSYGKGIEMDDPQVDRVTNALRAAKLNPFLDASIHDSDELLRAMNASEGGVLMVTPVSHLDPANARVEMLVLAYRRWAQPDFPIGAFLFRQSNFSSKAPAILSGLATVDLDQASDVDLQDYARQMFARLGRVPDEQAALATVRQRLIEFARKAFTSDNPPRGELPAHVADEVIQNGIGDDRFFRGGLSELAPADAREVTEIAAMFSFPASVSEPLRPVAGGSKARRAFSLNAMPLQVAHAVIRRAWLGRTPPASVVFRDQSLPSPEEVRARVREEVSKALPCSVDEARFLVDRVDATILIILMTRPLPPASYVEHVLELLPSAVFLFLVGSEGSTRGAEEIVTELRLSPGADMKFFERYKQMMEASVPRESDQPEVSASRPLKSKKSARKKPAKAPAEASTIFISSASASAALTDRLERAFAAAVLPVWRNRSDPAIGALLHRERHEAIRDSRVFVLVWSQAAARSRWISIEILTAFHLDRFILPCVTDATPLPAFLHHTQYVDLRVAGDEGVSRLIRAVAEVPAHRNQPPPVVSAQSSELNAAVARLERLQQDVIRMLTERDRAAAVEGQRLLGPEMARVERRWPSDLAIHTLAAYHRKNAYLVKHWDAIEAGRPPEDPLLLESERLFLDAALIDPQNVPVLNGLASILIFERELDAGEFFTERALELSRRANISNDAAE